MCLHQVADRSPPRGRAKLTSGAALWSKGTFEGAISLPLHVVSQRCRPPNRTFRIVQCPHPEFPEANVTEKGAAFLIHNQLPHVSLPGLDEFSPKLNVFQEWKISL